MSKRDDIDEFFDNRMVENVGLVPSEASLALAIGYRQAKEEESSQLEQSIEMFLFSSTMFDDIRAEVKKLWRNGKINRIGAFKILSEYGKRVAESESEL
jgi:hypothetical protein